MWVDSKSAAEILGVSCRAIQKATNKASQKGKKICQVKSNILNFCYTDSVGGASGKVLQIWIDENLQGDKNENTNRSGEELVQLESERSGRDGRLCDGGSLGVCGSDERVIRKRSANGGAGDKEAVKVYQESLPTSRRKAELVKANGNSIRANKNSPTGNLGLVYKENKDENKPRATKPKQDSQNRKCEDEARKASETSAEFGRRDRDISRAYGKQGSDERSKTVGVGSGVVGRGDEKRAIGKEKEQRNLGQENKKNEPDMFDNDDANDAWGESSCEYGAGGGDKGEIWDVNNENSVSLKSNSPAINRKQVEQELWLSLSEEKRAVARLKYELIKEYEKAVSMRAFLRVLHPKFLELEVKEHKIYRWLKIYKNALENGLNPMLELVDMRGKAEKVKSLDEEMQSFVVELVIKKPDISLRMVDSALKKQFMQVPTLSTISRFISGWKSENVILYEFAKNPTKATGKYRSAFGSMSEAVVRVNQLWEFDATPADVITKDGKRWTVSALMDIYSRRVVVVLGESSSSYLVSRVFREGIRKFGVPLTVRTDNGADYTSNHFDYICSKLRVNHELCPPFQGWKKPFIERFFGTLSRGLFKYLHGYVGANVAEKMEIVDRKTFEQKLQSIEKWKARHKNGDEFAKKWSLRKENRGLDIEVPLTKDELMSEIEKWINVYENELHSGIKTTPMMKFSECEEPVEMISNERVLDVLMGETKERVVQKKGIFVDGNNYVANELWLWVGQSVKLYMDDELSYVYVYSLEYEYICRAQCPEMLGISRIAYKEAGKQFDKFARKVTRINNELRAGGDTLMRDYLDERMQIEPVVLTVEKKEYVNESLRAISESVESEKVEVNEKVMFESLYDRFLWCFENDEWDEYSLQLKDEFAEDYERAEEHFRAFDVG